MANIMFCVVVQFLTVMTGAQLCDSEGDESSALQVARTPDKDAAEPELEQAAMSPQFQYDPSQAEPVPYLAMSWRIDSSQPKLVGPSRKIFEFETEDVASLPFSKMRHESISSESSKEYAKQISADLKVSGSGWGFEAAAEASLHSMGSSQSKQFRLDKFITAEQRKTSIVPLAPWAKLYPHVKDFMLNETVEKIHHVLGDFYATEITLGGVFQQTVTTEWRAGDTKTDLRAMVEGSYNALAYSARASVSGSTSVSAKIGSRAAKVSLKILGGNANVWLGLTGSNQDDIQTKWANTITASNMFPVNMHLVPLWTLLEDKTANPAKAAALQRYMVREWKAAAQSIPDHYIAKPEKGHLVLIGLNKRCKNYKVHGQWTRIAQQVKSRVEDCADLCRATEGCNRFSVSTVEHGKKETWASCLYTGRPHKCYMEAAQDGWGWATFEFA